MSAPKPLPLWRDRAALCLRAFVFVILGWLLPWLLAGAAATPAKEPMTNVPRPASAATSLYDVVTDLGRVDAMERDIETALRDTAGWEAAASVLDAPVLAAPLQTLAEGPDAPTRARYMELRALDAHLRERLAVVSDASATIGSLAQQFVAHLDRLDREAALWPGRSRLTRDADAPADIQRSVDAVIPALGELRERVVARRDQLLVAYGRAVRLQARVEGIRADVSQRRERLFTELRRSVTAPIWRNAGASLAFDGVVPDVSLMRFDFDWVTRHGGRLAFWWGVVFAAVLLGLRKRVAAPAHGVVPPLSWALALCGATLVAVVAVGAFGAFGPSGAPVVLHQLAWLCCPLLAAVVATHTFAREIRATAWTVSLAVVLNEFRVVAELIRLGDWLLLVLQTMPFAIALVRDWRHGRLGRAFPRLSSHALRRLVQADTALVAAALGLGAAGYVGAASLAVALGVIAPGYALSFTAAAWCVDRACAGLLALPIAQSLRSVRVKAEVMLRGVHHIVVAAAWVGSIAAFALSYSALDDVQRAVASLADSSVSAGDVTIRLRAIVSGLIVAGLTWLVTKVVRFVLDHELLPRFGLRAGVPIAISTVVGYVLVVIGAVLAMAALGVDFTKVTLLAGALGIGVGLGLQSVVNNFASGLIVMLERPINVGDQIDVGGVVGEVRRIGVRSSTIRTFEGAEIIVPNADLVSKQVTNWTLSDRARRFDIDVGVAQGSDPREVLRLLEHAAASVREVQKEPAPLAAFVGFGESTLDFRLHAWVESVDVGVQAQNGLRTEILRALNDAGIALPFPQRDVRIRCLTEPAAPRETAAKGLR